MNPPPYRQAIIDYIRVNAQPPDKFSHQARLHPLAQSLAEGRPYDDDVLFAAAWLHDIGVFIGHRPSDPVTLAKWDNVVYAVRQAPVLLARFGFPPEKIPATVEVIRTHVPAATPTCFEGSLLRDADLLEQLGAIAVLRTVSKVGRDTRFLRFGDALRVLRWAMEELPGQLQLESARRLAEPRVRFLERFLLAAEADAGGVDW